MRSIFQPIGKKGFLGSKVMVTDNTLIGGLSGVVWGVVTAVVIRAPEPPLS